MDSLVAVFFFFHGFSFLSLAAYWVESHQAKTRLGCQDSLSTIDILGLGEQTW
jgi:hypothetical protein